MRLDKVEILFDEDTFVWNLVVELKHVLVVQVCVKQNSATHCGVTVATNLQIKIAVDWWVIENDHDMRVELEITS